jgi:hypothetical protein
VRVSVGRARCLSFRTGCALLNGGEQPSTVGVLIANGQCFECESCHCSGQCSYEPRPVAVFDHARRDSKEPRPVDYRQCLIAA